MDTVTLTLLLFTAIVANTEFIDLPKFAEPITNVTVPVGREAILVCVVEDLAAYKVAWLRVDTQTILTIHSHVITKNHRIGVTHSDHRTWNLHIREVRQTDRGWYMCQINTDPMKSQVGFLEVVVSPDILDYPTSTDMIAEEGANVTLRCAVSGYPAPNVTWKREGGELLPSRFGKDVNSLDGSILNIRNVNRRHMGPYLCIASNGVPPSVSKRMLLVVHFPPMVWIPTKIVPARLGLSLTLECRSEAYPKGVNYWTKGNGDIIANGLKYANQVAGIGYNILMKLTIHSISKSDEGEYRCISRNSLGEVYDIIQVTIFEDVVSTGIPRHKELKLEGSDDVSSASKARSLSSSVISVFLIFIHWICIQLFYNKTRSEVILMSN